MKRSLIIAASLSLFTLTVEARTKLDGIAAVINDSIILQSELISTVKQTARKAQLSGQQAPSGQVFREKILEEMIIRELQLQRAKQLGLSVGDDAVDNAMRSIAQRNRLSLSAFRQQITKEGLNYTIFRNDIRNDLLMERLRDREVFRNIVVSDQEIEAELEGYYRTALARSEYELDHLVIPINDSASSADEAEAKDLIERLGRRLENGVTLKSLTGYDKTSGLKIEGQALGWMNSQQIPSLFTNELKTMSSGSVSNPIRSGKGWHIIRSKNVKGPGASSTQDVRNQIRGQIREAKAGSEFQDWISRLRETAYVELRPGNV